MQIMPVKIHDRGAKQNKIVNSGLLAGLPLCGFCHRRVRRLDVAAELHPELPLAMETQEHTIKSRRKDEAGPRDMLRAAIPVQSGISGSVEEPQVCVSRS